MKSVANLGLMYLSNLEMSKGQVRPKFRGCDVLCKCHMLKVSGRYDHSQPVGPHSPVIRRVSRPCTLSQSCHFPARGKVDRHPLAHYEASLLDQT